MSVIGSPNVTSLIQAAQAQQTASKARDRERAVEERTQRALDELELKVSAMESSEAVRRLPKNDSEQAKSEHESKDARRETEDEQASLDVTA